MSSKNLAKAVYFMLYDNFIIYIYQTNLIQRDVKLGNEKNIYVLMTSSSINVILLSLNYCNILRIAPRKTSLTHYKKKTIREVINICKTTIIEGAATVAFDALGS